MASNVFAHIAWIVLLGATVVGWHIANRTPLALPTMGDGPRGLADGEIVAVELHVDEDGMEEHRDVLYRYRLPDGREVAGRSYHGDLSHGIGQHRPVEYELAHPERSRIAGLDQTPSSVRDLVPVAAFLGLGLGLLGLAWTRVRSQTTLLAIGRQAIHARLDSIETTPVEEGRPYVIHKYDSLDGKPYTHRQRKPLYYPLEPAFQHIGILSLEFHVDKLSRPLL